MTIAVTNELLLLVDTTLGGPPLDDDYWHVTKYYENIRTKVKNLDKSVGSCYSAVAGTLPPRVCNTAIKVGDVFSVFGLKVTSSSRVVAYHYYVFACSFFLSFK